MKKQLQIVCFGEVLWDVFPKHQSIGGAPLNVAVRLKSFNNTVYMASRIGKDEKGKALFDFMKKCGLETNFIQKDDAYKTGIVRVALDDSGIATYDIVCPTAWDFIVFDSELLSVLNEANAFVFGSLIARESQSKNTLTQLLKTDCYKIFDVNLRAPYISKADILKFMNAADFIKFNDEELYVIADFLQSKFNNLEQNIKFIAAKTQTKHICVTKGPFGAVLFYNGTFYYNSGYRIQVKDTVGAGDSFLAALIYKLLSGEKPQNALNFACGVGALVAQESGANPVIALEKIQEFINPK